MFEKFSVTISVSCLLMAMLNKTYMLPGDTARKKDQLPWEQPDRLLDDFGVVLIGWPAGSVFRDPSSLAMWELRELTVGVYRGTCHFEYIGIPEKNIPEVEVVTKQSELEPRSDLACCRGRQARPAKPRRNGMTGKVFKSVAMISEEKD